MIHHRKIALPFLDRLGLGTVIALRLARQIGLEPRQPCLGLGLTVMCDHGRGECDHVGVFARAGTDTTFPFGVGQLLVSRNLPFFDPLFGGRNDPRPGGQTKPVPIGRAV